MTVVNTQEAKANLSKLLAQVEAGEEVVIARAGKPVARLVAVEQAPPRREIRLGTARELAKYFDDPLRELTDEELAEWYDAPLVSTAAPLDRCGASRAGLS